MAMEPEHNTDLGQEAAPIEAAPAVVPPTVATPAVESPIASPTVAPPQTIDPTPQVSPSSPPPTKEKRSPLKLILAIIVVLVLLAGTAVAAYHIGKGKRVVVHAAAPQHPINLPPQAIVTAACVPGRGKQYIIPKDIPEGPIYDVKNGKVIAIEYVIGIQQLLSNSNAFSSTLLLLTKNYPVDHFTVVPVPPQAGATDEYIHLIMFVVSAKEANSITCAATSTTSGSSTTPATTTTTQ